MYSEYLPEVFTESVMQKRHLQGFSLQGFKDTFITREAYQGLYNEKLIH